jgi:hypothetical protein
MRRGFWVATILASALCAATIARAEPTPAERETARRLMDEGKEKTKQNDLKGALAAYQKAHAIMHVPTTGVALARTHLALGHLIEARDTALEVSRFPRERGEPAVFEQARSEARDLEAQVKPRIPTLRIKVNGGPPASFNIDGASVSIALLEAPVAVNPGHHVVTAVSKDGGEGSAEVDVLESEQKAVEVTLAGTAPKATDHGPAAPPPEQSPSGGGAGKVLAIGGFGLAIVGVGVGTVTGLLARSAADRVKPACENNICDPSVKSDLDSSRSLATVSTVAFIAGGVGVAMGVVGLLLPSARPATGFVRPSVGPGSIGVEGAF